MCTGAEIAMAAQIASAVGTVVGTVGAIQQGRAADDMAEYNQQVAQNEAIAARQKAEFDERRHRMQAQQMKGSQRAALAQSGGELLDAGDVIDMTAEEAELDALAIRYGGQIGANAANQRGVIAGLEGKQAKREAYGKAGSTLLTGAASGLKMLGDKKKDTSLTQIPKNAPSGFGPRVQYARTN